MLHYQESSRPTTHEYISKAIYGRDRLYVNDKAAVHSIAGHNSVQFVGFDMKGTWNITMLDKRQPKTSFTVQWYSETGIDTIT